MNSKSAGLNNSNCVIRYIGGSDPIMIESSCWHLDSGATTVAIFAENAKSMNFKTEEIFVFLNGWEVSIFQDNKHSLISNKSTSRLTFMCTEKDLFVKTTAGGIMIHSCTSLKNSLFRWKVRSSLKVCCIKSITYVACISRPMKKSATCNVWSSCYLVQLARNVDFAKKGNA